MTVNVWRRIGLSWLGMKTWVKVWLFFLNGVFLAALCFQYDPLSSWTMIAYASSGPLLVGIAKAQRGLTRILGIAHLIPWIPLQMYLAARLSSDRAGPRLTIDGDPALFAYSLLLGATVAVCLAFDVSDMVRWIRGERYVIGSREAHAAGASRLTLD